MKPIITEQSARPLLPPGLRSHRKALATKAAECRAANKRLTEARMRLAGVRAKIRNAIRTGQLGHYQQLETAQRAVDANLDALAHSLEQLYKAGDPDWEALKSDLETGWTDLYRAVERLASLLDESPHA